MKIYGLIGFPLIQSFSKKYFDEKFEKEKILDSRFELYPLKNIEEFPELISSVENLSGLAVTIPYKEKIISFLDELDETAEEIGAVNCIQFINERLKGFNTDALGFLQSLKPLLKSHHKNALVLGTGGAAKAVWFALEKLNIPFKKVSRNKTIDTICYEELNQEIIESHQIIINCTPLGMVPNEDTFPQIPYQYLNENHLLYDLIYKPAETTFLEKGKEQNATIKNGLEMLYLQAEENWKIWNK